MTTKLVGISFVVVVSSANASMMHSVMVGALRGGRGNHERATNSI